MDVLMIVKNEVAGIQVTLRSLLAVAFPGRVFVYDTGSTDGTQDVARKVFGERLFVANGEFRNFAQARNDAHTWVRETFAPQWILWLDANDTVTGAPSPLGTADAFMVQQVWHSHGTNTTKFFNTRLFKLTSATEWCGYVHEWLRLPGEYITETLDPTVLQIVQNRGENSASSEARWATDVRLLKQQVLDMGEDSRTCFYLGRALRDTGNAVEARVWFAKRLVYPEFPEERFWARYFLAELETDDWRRRVTLFLTAYEECGRAEALVAAARTLNAEHQWHQSFMCCYTAAKLPFPESARLFVYADDYAYARWHLLGICAYYVGQFDVGRDACAQAIAARGLAIDIDNQKWYK